MIEISAAINAAKTIFEILSRSAKLIQDTEIKSAIFESASKALEMQQALVEANEEIVKLRKQIQDFDDWKLRSGSYKLVKVESAVVYQSLADDPKHFACPSCYEKNHQIQPLQNRSYDLGGYLCPGCESRYPIGLPATNDDIQVISNFNPRS